MINDGNSNFSQNRRNLRKRNVPSRANVLNKASKIISNAKERVPSAKDLPVRVPSRKDLQALRNRHRRNRQHEKGPLFSSNLVVKGKMYKKRSGVSGLATGIAAAILQESGPVYWHERFFVLEDGVLSYYKVRSNEAEHHGKGDGDIKYKTSDENVEKAGAPPSNEQGAETVDNIGDERGRLDLRQSGVQLRLNCGKHDSKANKSSYEGTGLETPTPFQFEIVYNSLRNPTEWQNWTICAQDSQDLHRWVAAITGVIYGTLQEEVEEYDEDGLELYMQFYTNQVEMYNYKHSKRKKYIAGFAPSTRRYVFALLLSMNIGVLFVQELENVKQTVIVLLIANILLSWQYHRVLNAVEFETEQQQHYNILERMRANFEEHQNKMASNTETKVSAGLFPFSTRFPDLPTVPISWVPDKPSWSHYRNVTPLEVRCGPDYKRNKMKKQSLPPLFVQTAADLFHSNFPLHHVASKIELPDVHDHGRPDLPIHLILNFQLPYNQQGQNSFINMVTYSTPSKEFLDDCKSIKSGHGKVSNASKLAFKWLNNCESDIKMKERLKLKAVILNDEECGFPWFLRRYNGKPVMVTKSARVHSDNTRRYLEIDVNVNEWGHLARKSVGSILPMVHKVDLVVSFVIQGETDDELPEQLLFAYRLSFPNPANAIHMN